MADISDLISYYANLLIIQYHNQPKAQATIELLAEIMLASGVAIDVMNAYDIDTAVGIQLDVIGKYVGVDRFYSEIVLTNYFSLVPQANYASLPTSPPQWGFTTQADFSDYNYNGTLVYNDIVTSTNALSDANFRTLIKLAILRNNINFSHAEIDNGMWSIFGSAARPESAGNMTIQYFIPGALTTTIAAALKKKLFPKPMGVRLQAITNILEDMFCFTDYTGAISPHGYGFSTYLNYDTLPGEVLTYSQISEQ